ncbi:MAG: DHHA1 domain-containing protein [Ignisphaera sp.]|uniref:DHH family phosphoesterase n=1 Tax=Ignisphaera aggregans TaxID=334771 RepID=A0A832CX10_9CREN
MRWVLFIHGDSDGVASGALAKAFLVSQGYGVDIVFTHPVGLLGDLKMFIDDAEGILIADIALNELQRDEILSVLNNLGENCKVIYIDHHPIPEDIDKQIKITWIHDTCCSASELTFRYLNKLGLDAEYSRIALYGAIGDYLDETPWVKQELYKWDKRAIYLEAGILIQGLEGSRRDYDFKRRVVDHLAQNKLPSIMSELVEKSLKQAIEDENLRVWIKQNIIKYNHIAYTVNPPGSIGKAANYSRIYGGAEVGIAIEDRGNLYVMSLRAEPGIDLNKILRKISKELGINAGGHPQAAGARVNKTMFKVFLNKLNEMLST